MRVLLVEDDVGIREGLVEIVGEFGTVSEAVDLPSALKALEQQQFDLVISDLNISGGVHGGRQIALAARERQCRVVIMSGSPRDDIERALEGCIPDGVVEKPFALEDVLRLLERERSRAL